MSEILWRADEHEPLTDCERGDAGVAVYVRACLDADPRFPIMDVVWA